MLRTIPYPARIIIHDERGGYTSYITPTSGVHDVYIVGLNSTLSSSKIKIKSFEFKKEAYADTALEEQVPDSAIKDYWSDTWQATDSFGRKVADYSEAGPVKEGSFTSSPIMMDVPNVTVNVEGGTINASKWMRIQNGGTNVSGVYAEKGTVEIGATAFENVKGPDVLALDGVTVTNTAKKATDKTLVAGATAYGDGSKLSGLKTGGFKVPAEVAGAADTAAKPKEDAANSIYVDRTGWKVEIEKDVITSYNDDGTVKSSFRNGQRIIDGNESTYWHSGYDVVGGHPTNQQQAPFDVDVTFDKRTAISGISFLPRQDELTGAITSAEYFFLIDGEYKVLGTYNYTANKLRKTESFTSNIEVDGIRMRVHVGAGGYASCAELNVLKANSEYATVTYDEFFENEAKNKLYPLDKEQVYMTAECNYEGTWDTHTLDKMFDGKDNLFWQSSFYSDGFTIEVTVICTALSSLPQSAIFPDRMMTTASGINTRYMQARTEKTSHRLQGLKTKSTAMMSRWSSSISR